MFLLPYFQIAIITITDFVLYKERQVEMRSTLKSSGAQHQILG